MDATPVTDYNEAFCVSDFVRLNIVQDLSIISLRKPQHDEVPSVVVVPSTVQQQSRVWNA